MPRRRARGRALELVISRSASGGEFFEVFQVADVGFFGGQSLEQGGLGGGHCRLDVGPGGVQPPGDVVKEVGFEGDRNLLLPKVEVGVQHGILHPPPLPVVLGWHGATAELGQGVEEFHPRPPSPVSLVKDGGGSAPNRSVRISAALVRL